jgi:predicted lipase
MAELASGAYQDPTTAETYARATLGAERVWWVEDNTSDTQAIVAAAGDTAIVAFRGSESGLDWGTNFEIDFEQYAFGVNAAGAEIIGGVHAGFLTAATAIVPALVEAIRESGATRVVLTGHSLGGALAVVVAALLEADPAAPPVSAVYTFGSPRTGDADWAAAYAALGLDEHTLR